MSRLYSSAVIVRNYRLFVPKTFRSQERKVPMENFRSPGRKVPGTFVPVPFRSRELSFPGNESSWELSFLGPFVPANFRFQSPPIFGPFLLSPNGWMHQDATWYRGRPQPRRASPTLKGHSPPIFVQCPLWPNDWMDEDRTWYGSRARPRPHCIRLGPSSA